MLGVLNLSVSRPKDNQERVPIAYPIANKLSTSGQNVRISQVIAISIKLKIK